MKPIFIHPVDALNMAPRSLMGAKAAGLANAAYYGANIPPSRHLISDDVETYLQKLSSYLPAKANWTQYSVSNIKTSEIQAFRQDILGSTPPETWTTALQNLFAEWNCTEIYIRSNFVCEDQHHGALAGCFTSKTCSNNAPSIREAIVSVLASGYEPSSVAVLMANGVPFDRIRPNILVQPVLSGSLGGIAFSRHPGQPWVLPQKGRPWGLVEWSKKGPQGVCDGDSAVEQAMFSATLGSTLDERKLFRALAKLVLRLEKKWATPVDIEWLWSRNRLVLLQVRPMADPVAQLAVRTKPHQTWSRHLTQERFPNPISPLGWSALQPSLKSSVQGLSEYLGIRVTDASLVASAVHGHVYANDKCFAFPWSTRLDLAFWLKPKILTRWITGLLLVLSTRRQNKRQSLLFQSCALLLHEPFQRLAHAYRSKRKGLDTQLQPLEQAAQQFYQGDATPSKSQLIDLFIKSIKIGQDFMHTDFAVFIFKELHAAVLKTHLASLNLPQSKSSRALAMADNPTLHMHDQFASLAAELVAWDGWSLVSQHLLTLKKIHAASLDQFQDVPKSLKEHWQTFWHQHGSLRFSWDLRDGHWLSDPKTLINLVRTFHMQGSAAELRSPSAPPSLAQAKPLSSVEEALQQRFKDLLWFDEDQHHSACRILSNAHDLVEMASGIFYAENLIHDPGDIYFLHVSELLDALAGKLNSIGFIAARRKSIWQHQTPNFAAIKTLGYDLDPKNRKLLKSNGDDLRMHGASAGSACGPAIVAENFTDMPAFSPGAILVTTSPKPEFAAIYPLLGGIVTRTGGMLAHGFVAARELGLPAISGCLEFDAIETGMILTIDGTLGTVTVGASP